MRQHALDNFKRVGVDVRNDTAVVEVRPPVQRTLQLLTACWRVRDPALEPAPSLSESRAVSRPVCHRPPKKPQPAGQPFPPLCLPSSA